MIEVYKQKQSSNGNGASHGYWDEHGWSELDICAIQESSSDKNLVDSILVNMEPRELDNYIRTRKITGENISRVVRTYKTTVYLLSLVLYYELHRRLEKEQEKSGYGEDQIHYDSCDMVSFIMKGLAKILLHLTTNENLIKELENANE